MLLEMGWEGLVTWMAGVLFQFRFADLLGGFSSYQTSLLNYTFTAQAFARPARRDIFHFASVLFYRNTLSVEAKKMPSAGRKWLPENRVEGDLCVFLRQTV